MMGELKHTTEWKLSVALSAFLILVLICSTIAAAYFSSFDQAINTLKVGFNDIDIDEEFDPPEELEPGVSFKKDIRVTNTGIVDCFVRVMVVYSDSDMGKYCTADWNDTDWVYNAEDHYWYYKAAIRPEETTTSLITNIKVSDSIEQAAIKDFDVIVYAESYQSYGFSDYAAAWEEYQKNKP